MIWYIHRPPPNDFAALTSPQSNVLRADTEKETIRTLLITLTSLTAHHTEDSYNTSNEVLLLCIGLHQPTVPQIEISDEDWEDLCREAGGWEWIDGEVEGDGRNEFGGKSTCAVVYLAGTACSRPANHVSPLQRKSA